MIKLAQASTQQKAVRLYKNIFNIKEELNNLPKSK